MATFNKFRCFVEDMAEGKHNLGSDTLKLVLTNSAPVNTNTVIGNITQIANGNGYTTGGATVTIASSSQAAGTYTLVSGADPVWTATGSMGPFQYVVLYNDTHATDPLIGWWDRGSALTLAGGDTFTPDLGTILTLV
jgi:hypothetical protein